MKTTVAKRIHRSRRHARVRARISGTAERPRVVVSRSNRYVFVQVVDDVAHRTLISSSVTPRTKTKMKGTKTEIASKIGAMVAEKMKEKGITAAVFDRGGLKYHGRVKAIADSLRAGGIRV